MNQSKYSFKVLHEQVEDQDLYPDKTHEKVSNTLKQLIFSGQDALTIGLEGAWGSGKSTVVNLLRRSIPEDEPPKGKGEDCDKNNSKKNGRTFFFHFDAWAHEGDPLRRMFLLKLIGELEGQLKKIQAQPSARQAKPELAKHRNLPSLGFICLVIVLVLSGGLQFGDMLAFSAIAGNWQQHVFWAVIVLAIVSCILGMAGLLKALRSAEEQHSEDPPPITRIKTELMGQKTVVVTTQPKITGLGLLFACSVLIIPIGAAFISSADSDKIILPVSQQAGSPHFMLWVGIILCLLPFAIGLFAWCRKGSTNSLFSAQSSQESTQHITEQGERTSIDFEEDFTTLMKSNIGTDKAFQRAIIVVDNLDRVSVEQARNVWSTLQTFFQFRSEAAGSNEEWHKGVWFLVPFDADSFAKIWQQEPQVTLVQQPESEMSPGLIAHKSVETASSSFLQKCFQITLAVPPPVMSNWADFLREEVKKAFADWPESSSDSQEQVVFTITQMLASLETSPTPRVIRTVINQVGILALRWGEEMSMEAITIYAVLQKCLNFSAHGIRDLVLKNYLTQYYPRPNGELSELLKELAGILFGVAADRGYELLLGGKISKAISEGNGEAIWLLFDDYTDAFGITWMDNSEGFLPKPGDVVDKDRHPQATKAIFDACQNSNELQQLVMSDTKELFDSWVNTLKSRRVPDCEFWPSLKMLMELNGNKEDQSSIIQAIEYRGRWVYEQFFAKGKAKDEDEQLVIQTLKILAGMKQNGMATNLTLTSLSSIDHLTAWGSWLANQNLAPSGIGLDVDPLLDEFRQRLSARDAFGLIALDFLSNQGLFYFLRNSTLSTGIADLLLNEFYLFDEDGKNQSSIDSSDVSLGEQINETAELMLKLALVNPKCAGRFANYLHKTETIHYWFDKSGVKLKNNKTCYLFALLLVAFYEGAKHRNEPYYFDTTALMSTYWEDPNKPERDLNALYKAFMEMQRLDILEAAAKDSRQLASRLLKSVDDKSKPK